MARFEWLSAQTHLDQDKLTEWRAQFEVSIKEMIALEDLFDEVSSDKLIRERVARDQAAEEEAQVGAM